jgi:hypothetical protein
MSDTVSRARPAGALIAVGATCLLWLIYATTSSDPLLGQDPIHIAIEVAAVLATALLFVLGGSTLAFAFLPGASHANALQRTLVYGVLTLVAAFVVLSHYGWDLRAALTTSAIVTAAIGLAMQPTLSSMISGVVLNIDYRLRVGDGIISGGETVEIASIGWRNVVARKSSGRLIVFPNAKLADAEVEFVPAGRPVRGETLLKLPTPMPPGQVGSLTAMLIGDLPALDPDRVVSVTPSGFDPSAAYTQYRVGYWVSDYRDLSPVENTIQQRLWYGLQRARLYVPAASEPDAPGDPLAWAAPVAIAELVMNCRTDLASDVARSLAEQGECLLFSAGENIALPIRLKGRSFLVLRGELVDAVALTVIEQSGQLRPSVHTLDQAGAERFVAARLARRIGPYADYAIWHAARDAVDIDEFCAAVAAEIPDESERARFLEEVRPARPAALKPGVTIRAEHNVAGLLVPHPRLRARDEVTLLAVPADLLPDRG